ncbi:NAD(P)-binding protein [Acephala macrosclerotiorum]|nr:NAD(P)-binding protein [Acephala macrosclerotiorum]
MARLPPTPRYGIRPHTWPSPQLVLSSHLQARQSLSQEVEQAYIIGRRTTVLDASKASINEQVGGKTRVLTSSADVSSKTQIDEAFEKISKTFRKIDILVPNAGNFTGIQPFGQETVDEWGRNLNVNVKGVYLVASAFIAHATENAKEHPKLHIINVHPEQVSETEMAGKLQGMEHIDNADLAGDFVVWLASEEAKFLKGKFVWVNWDVDRLKVNAKEIESTALLTIQLEGSSSFKY